MDLKRFSVGFVGAGQFSDCFIPLFKAHPGVSELMLCERDPVRLSQAASKYGISRVYATFDDLIASDVDAVAIFTQRHTHAPLALQALRAGKHVYCAVPAAVTLEELAELVETVKQTGLTYMMGETSFYYGATVFCREKWQAGEFGHFVYGEGEYLHDMSHGFYDAFKFSGGQDWKKVASYPPMFYPTHSIAMVLAVTGEKLTSVSAMGYKDKAGDGVFDRTASVWGNDFSNETALFRSSDGGMVRINEFRRVGANSSARSVRCSIFGTEAVFEEQPGSAVWTTRNGHVENVEARIQCGGVPTADALEMIRKNPKLQHDFISDYAEVQQKYRLRLPEVYQSHHTGHEGSHQFLVDDFVTAVNSGSLPPVHVWQAARYNAPGLVAHQSALKDGELLTIPDFGWPVF